MALRHYLSILNRPRWGNNTGEPKSVNKFSALFLLIIRVCRSLKKLTFQQWGVMKRCNRPRRTTFYKFFHSQMRSWLGIFTWKFDAITYKCKIGPCYASKEAHVNTDDHAKICFAKYGKIWEFWTNYGNSAFSNFANFLTAILPLLPHFSIFCLTDFEWLMCNKLLCAKETNVVHAHTQNLLSWKPYFKRYLKSL